MNAKPRHDFKPCVPGAFRGGLSRTAFFDGMVLTEDDMKREQGYWQMKRRLTNRALGQGVVWGLAVEWDEKARCFTVCPGYGLSCCGDDLVVECLETVCEGDLIDPCSEEFRRLLARKADPCDDHPRDRTVEACLMLEYVECPEDPRQVFEDPCAEQPRGCRWGAVRETVRLRLVPPPPPAPKGPIDRFCEKVDQIRAELAAAGVILPDPILTPGPIRTELAVALFDAAGEAMGGDARRLGIEVGNLATIDVQPGAAESITLSMEPPAGWVFAGARVNGAAVPGAQALMRLSATRSAGDVAAGISMTVETEVRPLFGGGSGRLVAWRITGGAAGAALTVSAEVLRVEELPGREGCAALLGGGFADGDAACRLRTLALALVAGWARGMLGSATCGDDGAEPPADQSALAWVICWVAWKVIYGIDIARTDAAAVEKCLQRLFADWCCGFHYKGPRCDCDAHGIILGCLTIDAKGRILCFDEWAHRRYVLTGPLLTHWGSQFGLAPVDVVATRLASWICCVARAPRPQRPDADLAAMQEVVLPVGGAGLGFGPGLSAATRFRGMPIQPRSSGAGPAEFLAAMLGAISADDRRLSTATAVRRITLKGSDLQLMLPIERPMSLVRRDSDATAALVSRFVEAAPPMARAASLDMSAALARSLALADLDEGESPVFEPMIRALDAEGISQVADLIEAGPEAALERVRPALTGDDRFAERGGPEKAMNLVYGAAQAAVSGTARAIAEAAASRDAEDPFIRGDLAEPATISAIRKAANAHLRGRGMTAAALRDIAARVVAAKP